MRFHMRSPALLLTAFILLIAIGTGALLQAALVQPFVDARIETEAGRLPVASIGGATEVLVGLLGADTGGRFESRADFARRIEQSPGLGIALDPRDFVEDPDMLPDYAASERFYHRQSVIADLLGRDQVMLVLADRAGGVRTETVAVSQTRGPGALPLPFWLQTGAGLVVIVIAAFFLALRPRNFAVSAFALAGLGITGAAYTAAIYSARQLGMDPGLMLTLSKLNHVFTLGFGIGILGLFSVYPARIANPWLVTVPAAIVAYGSNLLYRLEWLPHDVVMSQNAILLLLAGILALVMMQYRATRGRPADRAALLWLGVSVIFGSAAFVLFVTLPATLGYRGVVTQAFGFVMLAMIYVGTAFAISRYRLFDIGRWSYRILFYAGMIIALLAIDLAFIIGLQMSERTSLAIASAIVVILYFPLRDLVLERLFRKSGPDLPDLYRRAVTVAYQFSPAARQAAWMRVLDEAFRPGHVEAAAGGATAKLAIRNEGLEMDVPACSWSPALTMGFAGQGRRLFDGRDVRLAAELAAIAGAAVADRLSYEKGAEEERQRIARDLHDDVGATLLTGLHAEDEGRRQETLVEALSDIRRIAHGLAGRETVTERFIAQLRHETRERLSAHGMTLDWPLGSADDDGAVLPYRFHQNGAAMVREAVSNAIRHGGASAISITSEIAGGMLEIRVSNQLPGAVEFDAEGSGGGIGLKNIASRASELGGTVTAGIHEGRFLVSMTLPMPRGHA